MTNQVLNLEDQMSILMDLLKIPQEKRSFLELKVRMEKVIEENKCADCLNTHNQYDNEDSKGKEVIKENEHSNILITNNQSNNGNSQSMAKISTMMNILNNPGLAHLAENIFWNLDYDTLEVCRNINQSSKQILNNPSFWLWKFVQGGLSKENQKDWMNAIQLTKNSVMERNLLLYMKWIFKNKGAVELP